MNKNSSIVITMQCNFGFKLCGVAVFASLTASGKKLVFNLVVLALMLHSLLPEGRGANSLFAGWELSFIMLAALVLHLLVYVSDCRETASDDFLCSLTTCCRAFLSATVQFPYHTVIPKVRMCTYRRM